MYCVQYSATNLCCFPKTLEYPHEPKMRTTAITKANTCEQPVEHKIMLLELTNYVVLNLVKCNSLVSTFKIIIA